MGAKTWTLTFSDGDASKILKQGPSPDKDRAIDLAARIFPSGKYEAIEDVTLFSTDPPDNELYIGCYPGLTIVASSEFAIDYPSKLDHCFRRKDLGNTIHLHAMHSVVDWFAYAVWEGDRLLRSLSVSPDSGVIEDLGEKLAFEKPYWEGKYPAVDHEDDEEEYPLPFHPLELGEEALGEFFGYQLEGPADKQLIDPDDVILHAFKLKTSKWKFW